MLPFPSNAEQVDISVVIVSYNTREITLHCLQALTADLGKQASTSDQNTPKPALTFDIWVVDNASHDGSVEAIAQAFPEVNCVALEKNIGFGPANNRAFERAKGKTFLLLNSDAFVHQGAIKRLFQLLEENPKAGVIGPHLLNEDGSLQVSCWKFPSPVRTWLEGLGIARLFASHPQLGDYYRWAHDHERAVDFVIGACMLVRREVYEQIGGFDEAFFLYAEETDWQKRMHSAGWQVLFTPEAVVTHLGGASGAAETPRVSKLFWQGQERFILKHYGTLGWVTMRGGLFAGSMWRLVIFLLLALIPRKRHEARAKLHFFSAQAWRLISTRPPTAPST